MSDGTVALDREHILALTRDLWEPLRGERVFVTGGTGFVGTWMMEAFLAVNRAHNLRARAVLLTRNQRRFRERSPHLAGDEAIEFVSGDAISFKAPEGSFSFVVHAATERRFDADRDHPLSILEPDLAATRRVLDFAASHATRRLLFTSSGAVYGGADGRPDCIPETYGGAPDPTSASAAYGESKRLSEFACTSYARAFGFDAVVARLFAFVGPYLPLDEGYAAGNFLRDVLAGRPIAIAGDGTAERSYLYAADLAIWLWTMLLRGAGGRAYNVGSPQAISIRALAETIARTVTPHAAVTVAGKVDAGAAPSRYVPDTRRAEEELGLQAWIGLPEAIRRTYDYYQAPRRTTTAP